MNTQAIHLALINQAAKRARRREFGWQHYAEHCIDLIRAYRVRYGAEKATLDTDTPLS